jgi:hypothetical protein
MISDLIVYPFLVGKALLEDVKQRQAWKLLKGRTVMSGTVRLINST